MKRKDINFYRPWLHSHTLESVWLLRYTFAMTFRCLLLLAAASAALAGEWISLFDGKSFNGWIDPAKLSPPGDSWEIADGCIKARSHPKMREDLVSRESFTDFELEFEWRVLAKANSGVKYRIQDFAVLTKANKPPNLPKFERWVDHVLNNKLSDRKKLAPGDDSQIYSVGFEYQVIDDGGHADARRGGLYQAGSLYSMVGPAKPAAKPVGEFNQARIVVRGNRAEHWLNGVKVVDTALDVPAVKETLAKRWGTESPVYRLLTEAPKRNCPISLQNHNDETWFRNIRIRRL